MTQIYMWYAQQKLGTHNVHGAGNACTLTSMHITGRFIPWYMVPLRPPIYATTIYYHPKVHTGYMWMPYRYLIMPQLVAKQLCSWCFKCVFLTKDFWCIRSALKCVQSVSLCPGNGSASNVMHVGISNPRGRGKRSRHSRHMRNPQFYVSGKRPIASTSMTIDRAIRKCTLQTTICNNCCTTVIALASLLANVAQCHHVTTKIWINTG